MANSIRYILRLALGLLLLAPQFLLAWSGGVVSMPQGAARPKNRLRVTVDLRWVDSNGYRPVKVEVINWPPSPARADRSFRVALTPQSYYGYLMETVTGYVDLPQGASSATTTLSVPQRGVWSNLHLAVYEDGRRLKDLTGYIGIPNSGFREWSEAIPSVLVIDSDAPTPDERDRAIQRGMYRRGAPQSERRLPDVRALGAYFPSANEYGNSEFLRIGEDIDDVSTMLIMSHLSRHELLPPRSLPERWIDFTCFDVSFIPWDDLQLLATDHPSRFRALVDWTRAGQTLCVYDLDDEQLTALEQLLRLPGLTAEFGGQPGGWQAHRQTGRFPDGVKGLENAYRNYPQQEDLVRRLNRSRGSSSEAAPVGFRSRSCGMGRVIAMQADQPFDSASFSLPFLFDEIGRVNWMWYQRHGFSLHRDNDNYWNFMIPGVGRAPVNSYLVLITLFVILIGPVNYFVLRRHKRLYLLLVTVPAGAGAVTFALMNYALISDGLGVRSRIRSYTYLDQPAGHAVSWSRQCYYAGLAPSQGLVFPSNAAVYPIHQFPGDRRSLRSDHSLIWDEGQHLAKGYLASRSTAQFMVIAAGPSQHKLKLITDGGASPAVENGLGTDIEQLFLMDLQGKYYQANGIRDGQRGQLRPSDAGAVTAAYNRLLAENRPAFPEGYDARYYGNSLGFHRRYYYGWSNVDNGLPAPLFQVGLLERSLQQAVGRGGSGPRLEPSSYVAIVKRPASTPIGYERSQEEASFHVIYGRL